MSSSTSFATTQHHLPHVKYDELALSDIVDHNRNVEEIETHEPKEQGKHKEIAKTVVQLHVIRSSEGEGREGGREGVQQSVQIALT